MEHDYMHMKSQGRKSGTSRNLKVMVKLHMVSVDRMKIVKGTFMSLRRVNFTLVGQNFGWINLFWPLSFRTVFVY